MSYWARPSAVVIPLPRIEWHRTKGVMGVVEYSLGGLAGQGESSGPFLPVGALSLVAVAPSSLSLCLSWQQLLPCLAQPPTPFLCGVCWIG